MTRVLQVTLAVAGFLAAGCTTSANVVVAPADTRTAAPPTTGSAGTSAPHPIVAAFGTPTPTLTPPARPEVSLAPAPTVRATGTPRPLRPYEGFDWARYFNLPSV